MKFILSLVLVLIPCVSFSAPDKYTSYAMNTPVSVHDFAIYRTTEKLHDYIDSYMAENKELANHTEYTLETVQYDFNRNQYVVIVQILFDGEYSKSTLKSLSNDIIDGVKTTMGYFKYPEQEKYSPLLTTGSLLAMNMSNEGYSSKSKPQDLETEIDKKIVISVELSTKDKVKTHCVSDLISLQVMCSE